MWSLKWEREREREREKEREREREHKQLSYRDKIERKNKTLSFIMTFKSLSPAKCWSVLLTFGLCSKIIFASEQNFASVNEILVPGQSSVYDVNFYDKDDNTSKSKLTISNY